MNKTRNIVQWVASVFFLMSTIFFVSQSGYLSAATTFIFGLLLLPPFLPNIESALKREIKTWQVLVAFFLGFMVSSALVPEHIKQRWEAERIARAKESARLAEERRLRQEEEKRKQDAETEKRRQEEATAAHTQKKEEKAKAKKSETKKANTDANSKLPSDTDEKNGALAKFSKEQRKNIWQEVILAERRASTDTEAVYDLSKMEGTPQEKSIVFGKYMQKRLEEYMSKIYKKYSINEKDISHISYEAEKERWEKPKNQTGY